MWLLKRQTEIERGEGNRLALGGICVCVLSRVCESSVFCTMCLFLFVSAFCVCCNSFGECEVCLCDVPTTSPATHGDSHICFCLFSCFYYSNRELPFAHHPARSNHHHHQLPRHPALSPRCHWEVFNDQRATAGPASQWLAHPAQRQAELRHC